MAKEKREVARKTMSTFSESNYEEDEEEEANNEAASGLDDRSSASSGMLTLSDLSPNPRNQ